MEEIKSRACRSSQGRETEKIKARGELTYKATDKFRQVYCVPIVLPYYLLMLPRRLPAHVFANVITDTPRGKALDVNIVDGRIEGRNRVRFLSRRYQDNDRRVELLLNRGQPFKHRTSRLPIPRSISTISQHFPHLRRTRRLARTSHQPCTCRSGLRF